MSNKRNEGEFWMMGGALAMAISFTTWKSILWAIVHGLFGWIYVIYFAVTRAA